MFEFYTDYTGYVPFAGFANFARNAAVFSVGAAIASEIARCALPALGYDNPLISTVLAKSAEVTGTAAMGGLAMTTVTILTFVYAAS